VEAIGLNKWVRKDLNILQNISLAFQPRELVVVVGQSGGGKSTLVDAIIGYRPATHGQVLVNGTNVYRNFDAVRNDIGFVPQRDIIHTGLTVYQALNYTARLRMPRDTSKAERHKRILEVLEDLDLLHRKDNPISRLTGVRVDALIGCHVHGGRTLPFSSISRPFRSRAPRVCSSSHATRYPISTLSSPSSRMTATNSTEV
jgi:ABC-type sugar transport system ATPase subunit